MSRGGAGRLTRIHIENLACFGDLALEPGALTLLVGINGAGKSTLLDVLFDLREIVNHDASIDVLPGYAISDGPTRIGVDLELSKAPFRYELELKEVAPGQRAASNGLFKADWEIVREVLRIGERMLTNFNDGIFTSADVTGPIPLTKTRSVLATVTYSEASPVWNFKRWADSIWLLRLEPQQMKSSAEEPDGLDCSGINFVAWLLSLRPRKHALARICEAARSSVHGLAELVLERAGREWVLVALFTSGAKVDFDALSDGQRCLIVLHAVLQFAQRDCSLLLLDEPDAHVTPTEILPLFAALRSQAAKAGMQVIVASHHPQVIDLLAPDTPWEMVLRDGKVFAEPFRVDLSRGVSASRHLLLRGRR